MSVAFDPTRSLIVVPATVEGPVGRSVVKMALDTGATKTVIRTAILTALGYDPAGATEQVQAATASGIEVLPKLAVAGIDSLGRVHRGLTVLAHSLPPSAQIDGLLGLDFLRRGKLTIDFDNRQVTLS